MSAIDVQRTKAGLTKPEAEVDVLVVLGKVSLVVARGQR
jgi:hypothetical protein